MTSADKPTKQDLHVARSELLDAFAEVEGTISRLERKRELKPNNASLGQKIGRLRKPSGGPMDEELSHLLDELTKLNEIRAELVHRPMNIVSVQGTTKALFIARLDDPKTPTVARVISLDQFRSMITDLKTLDKKIAALT